MPLQDHALALLMAIALTRATGQGNDLVSRVGRRIIDNVATLQASELARLDALRTVGNELETAATEITRAADSRATRFQVILRRLIKKCNREPESKEQHKHWWEQLLVH